MEHCSARASEMHSPAPNFFFMMTRTIAGDHINFYPMYSKKKPSSSADGRKKKTGTTMKVKKQTLSPFTHLAPYASHSSLSNTKTFP